MISRAAKWTKGAAGPSSTDADFFRFILLHKSFKSAGQELREESARFARIIASEYLNPETLDAYVNCRLIPLDKCPGLRPIGIGETFRRIIGKAISWSLKKDIQETAGPLQVCTGLRSGSEAAVHFIREQFEKETAEACILVDASNAFNAVNRQVMLHNIQRQLPEFAPIAINMYRSACRLFVCGTEIRSEEGTTQGDNLAMSLFAMATLPILQSMEKLNTVAQVWLADDATSVGKLPELRLWWDGIVSEGLKHGYYVNASKSFLILKDSVDTERATAIFEGSGITIKSTGQRHLGAVIGSDEYKEEYIEQLLEDWSEMITTLADFAKTQPHAAYCAFTHGVRHKMTYFMRTIGGLCGKLEHLDKLIDEKFIPELFGCHITPFERRVMALPVRYGGLGLPILSRLTTEEYNISMSVTRQLVLDMEGIPVEERQEVSSTNTNRVEQWQTEYQAIVDQCDERLVRILQQAKEKCSSSWLSALPLKRYGFVLNKGEFRDSLRIRYGKDLARLPESCACGSKMTINHALNCPRGGYVIIRHNAVRDFLAEQLSGVCSDVQVEPPLQPLDGESFSRRTALTGEQARPDIRARGFYRAGQQAFFDVKMLNPNSDSYVKIPTTKVYQNAEQAKKSLYNERIIEVEQGTFAPLIFSVTGGMGPEALFFTRLLCDKIAHKTKQEYSCVTNFFKCKLSFLIRKLVLLCIRGSRKIKQTESNISESDFEFGCFASKLK